MTILVNQKQYEVADLLTVANLLSHLALPTEGVALAVNNRVVSRTEWESHMLAQDDQVVLFRATCGG